MAMIFFYLDYQLKVSDFPVLVFWKGVNRVQLKVLGMLMICILAFPQFINAQYCLSGPIVTDSEHITYVSFANISNPSEADGYSDYTQTHIANVAAGHTYPISVSVYNPESFGYTQTVRVWIDWNQDEIFDPVTEQYDLGSVIVAGETTHVFTGSITVPDSVLGIQTRMRITNKYYFYAGPCEEFGHGEVEDYGVQVSLTTCQSPADLTAVATDSSAILSWGDYDSASVWLVEYGLYGFTPTGTPDIVTSNPYAIISGLSENTEYQYYVSLICNNGDTSLVAGPYTFKTFCSGITSGTVTINAALPAGNGNYQSFTALAEFLNLCGISGPLTVNVAHSSGPYVEQVVFHEISGTSATNTITINGNGNILQFDSSNETDKATMKMIGTSYMTIDSLHIQSLDTGENTEGFAVHLMNGTNFITFNNCIIEAPVTGSNPSQIPFIASNSNIPSDPSGLAASNLQVTNCQIKGGWHGMVINGPASAPFAENNIVKNNTIISYNAIGLFFKGQQYGLFDRNNISRGVRTYNINSYGVVIEGKNPGTHLSNNRIHNPLGASAGSTNTVYAIYGVSASGEATDRLNIFNNLIYNINTSGIQYGFYFAASEYLNVYHNSVSLANAGATGNSVVRGIYLMQTGSGNGSVEVKNNIFHISNQNTGVKSGLHISGLNVNLISNNNVINMASTNGTNITGAIGTTTYNTLSNWQTAGFDLNSVAVNPDFVDENANLFPQAEEIASAGTNLNAVAPIDYFGFQRPEQPTPGAIHLEILTCNTEGLAVTTSESSALITWFENALADSFNVEYGLSGFIPGTGTTAVTTVNSYEINNLMAGTSYDFYVKAICSQDSLGSWAGPLTFSTQCEFLNGTYTLGTPTSDFLNFTALADFLNCGGVNGHVTIIVEENSGPFIEQVVFSIISGASDSSTITVIGNGNVLDLSQLVEPDHRATLKFDGTGFFSIHNLHIKSSSVSAFGWVIHIANDAHHITIDNCIIENNITQTGTGYAGIVVTNHNDVATSAGFSGHHITIANNEIIGGHYGISVAGPSGISSFTSNNIIENNQIRDFNSYGIYARALKHSKIEANEITRPNRITTAFFYGIYCIGGNWSGTTISNNLIHNTRGLAAVSTSQSFPMFFSEVTGSESDPVNIFNNVVYNINNNGIQYGIFVTGMNTAYLNFYHNTISLANTTATGFDGIYAYYQLSTIAGSVNLQNNIFHIANGNSGPKYCIFINSAVSNVYSNNNVLSMASNTGGLLAKGFYGATYVSLQSWQAAGFDLLSSDANPVFINQALNVIPQNPLIKGIGANLNNIAPFDNLGSLRPANPDPGAYQYEVPMCYTQPDVSIEMIADTYIELSWSSVSEALSYQIEYGPAGFTLGTGIIINTSDSFYTISMLVKETEYDVYVRTNCGTVGFSNWSGPLTIQTVCLPLAGSSYTIGGFSADFQTFSDFVYALICGGVSGSVIVNVTPGSGPFFEQIVIPVIYGVSDINTITIIGNGNVLEFSPTESDERATLKLKGASHFIFNDLHIKSIPQTNFGFAVQLMENANHNTFTNCIFVSDTEQTGNGFAAFAVSNSNTSATSIGETASYLTITDSEFIGGHYGLTLTWNTLGTIAQNNVIENNIIRDFHSYGIWLESQENAVIQGNILSRPERGTYGTFNAIHIVNEMPGTKVSGNVIHHSVAFPLPNSGVANPISINNGFGQPGQPLTIYNNLIYNIGNSGSTSAIRITGASAGYINFYHNTISLTKPAGASFTRAVFMSGAGSGPIEFKNNIFHLEDGSSGDSHCLYFTSNMIDLISDNNVLSMASTAGANNLAFFGGNVSDLDDWQLLGFDLNSSDENPVFINSNSNLIPQNALISNIGEDLTSIVPFDFFGITRSTSPDPGAIEFDPPGCLPVTNIVVSEITPTTALVSWVETGDAVLWDIEYVKAGFAPTGSPTVSGATNPHLITDLDELSAYNVYVRADCGAAGASVWVGPVNFNTLCMMPLVMVAGDSVCMGGTALLIALPVSPVENINWFDQPEGGNLVNQGEVFEIPDVEETITYFVEAVAGSITANLGPLDADIGPAANYTLLSSASLTFEVFETITINQLTLYPSGNGVVDIEVRTNSGNQLIMNQVVSVSGDGSTPFAADVDFNLPPGEYRLGANTINSTVGLLRNFTGAVYPYVIPGAIAITGNTVYPTHYYHFYNWEVTLYSGCTGDRIPVNAVAIPNPEVTLNLNLSDTICIAHGSVELSGASPSGGTWSGQGVTDNSFNPKLAGIGMHEIIYTFTDSNNCSASVSASVFVDMCISTNDLLISGVTIFPNPFNQFVDIHWQQLPANTAEIRVIDMLGRILKYDRLEDNDVQRSTYRVHLDQLPTGTYIIELSTGEASYRQTILKVE